MQPPKINDCLVRQIDPQTHRVVFGERTSPTQIFGTVWKDHGLEDLRRLQHRLADHLAQSPPRSIVLENCWTHPVGWPEDQRVTVELSEVVARQLLEKVTKHLVDVEAGHPKSGEGQAFPGVSWS